MKFKRFFGIVHSTTTVVLFVRLLNSKYVNYLMPFYNRNINIMKQINCFYYEFGWHKTSKCDRCFVFFYRKILSLSANNLEYEQRKKHSKTTVTDTHKKQKHTTQFTPNARKNSMNSLEFGYKKPQAVKLNKICRCFCTHQISFSIFSWIVWPLREMYVSVVFYFN